MRNNPKNTKVSEGERGAPEAVGDILLQPVSFGRDHNGVGISLENFSSQRGSYQSRYSHCSMWSILVQGRLIFPAVLLPVERPCWRRFILKDTSPWYGLMQEQGKSIKRKVQSRGARPTKNTHSPSPLHQVRWGGKRRVRNEATKLGQEKVKQGKVF